jgi:hypothetical protein
MGSPTRSEKGDNVNVQVTISLGANDEGITDTPTEIAQKILDALGGNSEKDVANVSINANGSAGGTLQPPPVPVSETSADA